MKRNVAAVADHYNSLPDMGKKFRDKSPILNLRQFNNWVKSVLIRKTASKIPGKISVLDMCCGKGGDLLKYRANESIQYYRGLDIASESIKDAHQRLARAKVSFKADFHTYDCFQEPFDQSLVNKFDLVSCMFALHYAFGSLSSAKQAFENIGKALKPGGYFIAALPAEFILSKYKDSFRNSICTINFKTKIESMKVVSDSSVKEDAPEAETRGVVEEKHVGGSEKSADDTLSALFKSIRAYDFYLIESVYDCEEYTVPIPLIKHLCQMNNLEFVNALTFDDYYDVNRTENKDLLDTFKLLDNNELVLSEEEIQVAELYMVMVIKKL